MLRKMSLLIFPFTCVLGLHSCQKVLIPDSHISQDRSPADYSNVLSNNSFYPEFRVTPPLQLIKEFRPSSAAQQKLQISGSILFVPTKDGKIETYELNTLKPLGRYKISKKIRTNVLPVRNNLLIAQEYGKKSLYLFDPSKNKKLWTAEIGSIKSLPKVDRNKIFVASLYHGLYCLNLEDGAEIWNFKIDSQLHTSSVVHESAIYQISEKGVLFSIDPVRGMERWKVMIGKAGLVDPVLGKNEIICCSSAGEVSSVTFDGDIVWQFNCRAAVRRTPAISDELVIIACQNGSVFALNIHSGDLIWRHDEAVVFGTNPVVSDQYVILGTLDKRLLFLELNTGTPVWELELFGRVRTDPLPWKDRLIVGSENNHIYVLVENL